MSIKILYVATPISLYNSYKYVNIVNFINKQLDYDIVIYAKYLYDNHNDWLVKWSNLLKEINALIFFDANGTIGRGVYREIEDMFNVKKPVFYGVLPNKIYKLTSLKNDTSIHFVVNRNNLREYAKVQVVDDTLFTKLF